MRIKSHQSPNKLKLNQTTQLMEQKEKITTAEMTDSIADFYSMKLKTERTR